MDEKDVQPIQQFLNLVQNMKVALLLGFACDVHYAKIGVIVGSFPRGFWEGFQVPHSFYVIVKLVTMNDRFTKHIAYEKMPNLVTMDGSVN